MIWPENCVSLAKKELFYAGPFGIGAWMCGTIYIDRLNHESARKTMEDTADLIKHKKVHTITGVISFQFLIRQGYKWYCHN